MKTPVHSPRSTVHSLQSTAGPQRSRGRSRAADTEPWTADCGPRTVDRGPAALTFEPAPDFRDPRLSPGFDRRCWPLCNGGPAPPPNATGLHERRCLEFLAAFYQLNLLNKRLLALRNQRAPRRRIKSVLDRIASDMAAIEALEDRYAPIGFFGEPVMKGMLYHNIVFVRPELPTLYPRASMLSSHFAIPGLEKIPASELRGPVKVFRFGHGEVDL